MRTDASGSVALTWTLGRSAGSHTLGVHLDGLKESLRVAALLEKPGKSAYDGPLEYIGFKIPNKFVVGFGLDYAQRYRNLPFIGTLAPAVYGGG